MNYLNTLSCFEIVGKTLNGLYFELSEETRDDEIKAALVNLREGYQCLKWGGTIDYSGLATQFAYLYCYATAHANVIYDLIGETQELNSLFDEEQVRISCLGGGSGIELLGIKKFIQKFGKSTKLTCNIYDKEVACYNTLYSLSQNFDSSFSHESEFRTLDVFDSRTWNKSTENHKVDLYVMSFFLSEVYSRKKNAEKFFLDLFGEIKEDAYILFVDNISVESHIWFDKMVEKYNCYEQDYIDIIFTRDKREFRLEHSEQARDLCSHYTNFRETGHPRTKTCANYRICRKQ